jgi:transposase
MRRFHTPRSRWTEPRPWQPLSDAEYAALCAFLPAAEGRRGRPPADRRRTLDAIFWVACSRGPWRDLPPDLGKPDTAHRTLRRLAAAGHLDRLLLAVSGRDWTAAASPVLRALEYWVCRAWRRMARLASLGSLELVKRLGLFTAMPCAPWFLPDPDLSETLNRYAVRLLTAVIEEGHRPPRGHLARLGRLIGFTGGNRRHWRLA